MLQPEKIKQYSFGGILIEVRSSIPLKVGPKYDLFAVESVHAPDYIIEIIPMQERQSPAVCRSTPGNGEATYIRVELNSAAISKLSLGRLFTMAEIPYLFLDHEAFILHASYILREGKAVLFTAPSGVGKSTQAGFWHDCCGTEVINGDRVLITRNDDQYFANGIYLTGKSGLCQNVTAPIDQIILLEQGQKNELREIRPYELFLRVLCQCTYNMNAEVQCSAITGLLEDLFKSVPVHCYRCRNHVDSVTDLERYLWGKS